MRCTVRLSRPGASRASRALLTRKGALYASGSARGGSKRIRLRVHRPLRAGRYTLTLLSTDRSGTTTATRHTVNMR